MGKAFNAADMLDRGRTAAKMETEPRQEDQSSTSLVAKSEPLQGVPIGQLTYKKMAISLTPGQRKWLKAVTPSLGIEGLSASDVARLAISRLQIDVDGGLPLADLLVEQAHEEAQLLTGRRNRGMPHRAGDLSCEGDGRAPTKAVKGRVIRR